MTPQAIASLAICLVSVLFVLVCYLILAGQREDDRREFLDLRADFVALLDHLGLEITAGWPEQEPAPVDDTPTGPIPIVEPTPDTAPLERVWDQAVAELIAAEPQEPRTVERTVNGMTFRIREDAA